MDEDYDSDGSYDLELERARESEMAAEAVAQSTDIRTNRDVSVICIGHVWAWVRFPPNVGYVFPQMYFVVFGGILMYPSRVRYRCVSKRPSKYTQKTTDTDHKQKPSIGQVLSCILHVSNGSKLGCRYSHAS